MAPNQDQHTLWNEAGGDTWVRMQPILDRMFEPLNALMTEGLLGDAVRSVLDVGCGAGATTIATARQLGPGATCLGVDISGPLVETASRRAAAEGLAYVRFVHADAQTYAFEPGRFDLVQSRFGVMFFDDPVAAFTNIRPAARAGGVLSAMAWRSPSDNPFMTTATRAAAPWLPSLPKPEPSAPGQFGFADRAFVRSILDASGWTGITVEPVDLTIALTRADLHAYITTIGPVGLAMRDMDDTTRSAVTAALVEAFERFVEGDRARFTAACWRVRATA